jgi:centrosomal protein CEP290
MPDPSLPIPNQLEQAISIIRDHIKLLAEAKVQADLAKKRVTELEEKLRKTDNDVTLRDKIIADLRLRLPATADRDLIIDSVMSGQKSESSTPVRAAQSTIEGLQVYISEIVFFLCCCFTSKLF